MASTLLILCRILFFNLKKKKRCLKAYYNVPGEGTEAYEFKKFSKSPKRLGSNIQQKARPQRAFTFSVFVWKKNPTS